MGKRANPMAIKAALTYEVSEAALALGKSPATIRIWIKDGLPVMSDRKPLLISGEALRDYLRTKNHTAKRPLEPNELYCCTCRMGRKPLDMVVTCISNTPKTARLVGVCNLCGVRAVRIISNAEIRQFVQIFNFIKGEPSETY